MPISISSYQEILNFYTIEIFILENSKRTIEEVIKEELTKEEKLQFETILGSPHKNGNQVNIRNIIKASSISAQQKLRYSYIFSLKIFLTQVKFHLKKIKDSDFNREHKKFFSLLRDLSDTFTKFFFRIIHSDNIKRTEKKALTSNINNVLLNILNPNCYEEIPDWDNFTMNDLKLKVSLKNSSDWKKLRHSHILKDLFNIENVVMEQIENLTPDDSFVLPNIRHTSYLKTPLLLKSIYTNDPVYEQYRAELKTRNDNLDKFNKGYQKIKFSDTGDNAMGIKDYYKNQIHGHNAEYLDEVKEAIEIKTSIFEIEKYFKEQNLNCIPIGDQEENLSLIEFKKEIVNNWTTAKNATDKHKAILEFRKQQIEKEKYIKHFFTKTTEMKVIGPEVANKMFQSFGSHIGHSWAMAILSDKDSHFLDELISKPFKNGESTAKSLMSIALVLLPLGKSIPILSAFTPLVEGILTGFLEAKTTASEEYKKLVAMDKKLDRILLEISNVASDVLLGIEVSETQKEFAEIKKSIENDSLRFVDLKTFHLEIEKGKATKEQIKIVKLQLNNYKVTLDNITKLAFGSKFSVEKILNFDQKEDTFAPDAYVTILLNSFLKDQERHSNNTVYTFHKMYQDVNTFFTLLEECFNAFLVNTTAFQESISSYAMKTSDDAERLDARNTITLYSKFNTVIHSKGNDVVKETLEVVGLKNACSDIIEKKKLDKIKNFLLSNIAAEYNEILDQKQFVISTDKKLLILSEELSYKILSVEKDSLVCTTIKGSKITSEFNKYYFKTYREETFNPGTFLIESGAQSSTSVPKYLKVNTTNRIVTTTKQEEATKFSINMDKNRELYLGLADDPKKVIDKDMKIGAKHQSLYFSVFDIPCTTENFDENFLGLNLYANLQPGNYIENNTRYYSPNKSYYLTSENGALEVYEKTDIEKEDRLHFNLGQQKSEDTKQRREILYKTDGSLEFISTEIKKSKKLVAGSGAEDKFEFITKTVDKFNHGYNNSELSLDDEGCIVIKDRAGDIVWESKKKHTINYPKFTAPSESNYFILTAHCNFEKSYDHYYEASYVNKIAYPAVYKKDAKKQSVSEDFFVSVSEGTSSPRLNSHAKELTLCRFEYNEDYFLIIGKMANGNDLYLTELESSRSLSWKTKADGNKDQKFGIGWKYSAAKEELFYIWSKNSGGSDMSKKKLGYPSYENIGRNKSEVILSEACTHSQVILGGDMPLYFRQIYRQNIVQETSLENLSGACYNSSEEKYYFFRGIFYWERKRGKNIQGPFSITRFDKNMPSDINAACYSSAKKAFFFFKEGKCYTKKEGALLEEETTLKWGNTELLNSLNAVCYARGSYYLIANGLSYNVNPDTGKVISTKTVSVDWGSNTPNRPDAMCYAGHVNSNKGGYYFFYQSKYQNRTVGDKTEANKYNIDKF